MAFSSSTLTNRAMSVTLSEAVMYTFCDPSSWITISVSFLLDMKTFRGLMSFG